MKDISYNFNLNTCGDLLKRSPQNINKGVLVMSEQTKSSISVSYYVHTIIVFVLMFGFPRLPLIEPLTPYGMHVVGIFLGCLYGWTMIGPIWPSFLGLIVLGFTEFGTMTDAFKEAYGGDTYLFVFFMLSFAALFHRPV